MKIVKYEDSERFVRGNECTVWEYQIDDKDINIGLAEISGRYPEKGYAINEKCKEIIYVISGSGILYKKGSKEVEFKEKDVIFIDRNEPYYWLGNCTVLMPCTPAWYIEQYKTAD